MISVSKTWAVFLSVTPAVFLTVGCEKKVPESGGKDEGQTTGKADLQIKVPEAGNVYERVRSLWAATMPVIRADASAGLSDAEYQSRRLQLFSAWVMLQQANTNAQPPAKEVEQLIPDILGLIDRLYGFPGTPVAEREKQRQDKSRIEHMITDIEKQVQALPK